MFQKPVFYLSLFAICIFSVTTLHAAPKPPADAVQAGAAANRSMEMNEQGAAALLAKNYSEAEERFRKALVADSGNVTAAYNLAGVYLVLKKEAEAIALLEEYAKKYPADAGFCARLGDAYFAGRQVAEAKPWYEKALAIDPKYAGLAAKLGTIYSLAGDLKQAEKVLLLAVEDQPQDGQLLANLASVFLANGKVDKAISTARRGLQVTTNPELYITLGTAYEASKDSKNALNAFQRALDLGSTREGLKEKVAELGGRASAK